MKSRRAKADLIERLVKDFIREYGCGDRTCDSCKIGISIGLPVLDKVFNAGHKAGEEKQSPSREV